MALGDESWKPSMGRISYAGTTIFRFRWLLYELVLRDLKLRYRNSLLGFAWTIMNPILFMLLYTFVFSVILRVRVADFPLYLLAGLVPWNWVTGAIPAATTAIIDGRMYVGKTVFPIEMLVLVPVLSNAVNFALSLVLLLAFLPLLGGHFSWALTLLPVVIVGEFLVVLGLGFLVATFNTLYRDLQQLVGYVLNALFFVTPIFYTSASAPRHLEFMFTWSPFAAMVEAYHSIFYAAAVPKMGNVVFLFVFGGVVLMLGIGYFDRYRDHFGEYL